MQAKRSIDRDAAEWAASSTSSAQSATRSAPSARFSRPIHHAGIVTSNPDAISVRAWSESSVVALDSDDVRALSGVDPHDETNKDHFIERDGMLFAGVHLIVDFWGASRLGELAWMEQALRRSVEVAGATLLHIHVHHFGGDSGVSGVAVLAESHISVHTWPERDFAAFDIFMCGDARPELAIGVLREAFEPERVEIAEARRGIVDPGPRRGTHE